ncbi:hypothetical protein WA026_005588 [Henosepilachna vigintioctopunctata]|uniref:Uncharacterized protein n=1 Tax=Henosepilachna vigintioctopunctata TaxID=420089 RepID=A0AAW1TT89_9CUCU
MGFRKFNQTHSTWSFQVNFIDDIDENIWFQSTLERWAHGRWANIPFLGKQRDPCRTIYKYFPEIWLMFSTTLNIKPRDKCPVPKGLYTVKNHPIGWVHTKFPMWEGKMRVKLRWTGSENMKNDYLCMILNLDCSANKDVEIESITVCPNNEQNRYPINGMTFKKINHTHSAWSFQVNFIDNIDEKIWFYTTLERWTHGRWASIPFLGKQKDPCRTILKYFPQPWIMFETALNINPPTKCPIPKGIYTVKNYSIKLTNTKFPMWYGKMRINLIWTGSEDLKDVYMCMILNLDVKDSI